VAYYTLSTFNNIIKKNKLKIIDCSLNKINGGSIEIVCSRIDSKFKIKKSKINKIFYKESLINDNSYKIFNHKLLSHKYKIKSFFKNNTDKNNIIGYGAATKGNIILNYCGLNKKNINFIADANSYKIGRYTPGSNIKIISKKKINSLSPNYLFVLIWSFKSEVIRQEIKFLKNGGKLIFPLPYFHIITKKNYYKHI
jgi:NDP-4-keto-2,6-dideoxyhexose 3-C-methyltransferase